MNISELGLQRLALWEGEVKNALGLHVMYEDAAGFPTIGIGHLLTEQELDTGEILIEGGSIDWMLGLDDEDAYLLLSSDVEWAKDAVNENVKVFLFQNQFDTLVSFVFNVGETNFRASTLLRVLNRANYAAVPNQLKRWNKAGGETLRGLTIRRQHEIDQWNE